MHAAKRTGPGQTPDELENYRRLVELQSQIVEQARRNREAERSCQLLREYLRLESSGRWRGKARRILLRLVERIRQTPAQRKPMSPAGRPQGPRRPGTWTQAPIPSTLTSTNPGEIH